MMEKLSAKEFDLNYEAVLKRVEAALKKSGRKRRNDSHDHLIGI